ncbi:MAG: methyltransferase domain-containing protein [Granulosicoccus sp.]
MESLIQPAKSAVVARQFRRAARTFAANAGVFEVVGERLRERLDLLAVEPSSVLDLGCRSGYQLSALQARYPKARVLGVDFAPDVTTDTSTVWPAWMPRRRPTTRRIAADPHVLPFAEGSFDLVVSNLLLPFCHSPHRVFSEVARVLALDGAFLFTSAGPDTLCEYRSAWAGIDSHLHVFGLIDMHDLGDAMLTAGFAAPVLDRTNLIVDYPSIDALQKELREVGAANLALGRRPGLMSATVRDALRASKHGERYPVTLELVQGHAWKGELKKNQPNGEFAISVDSLRRSLKR